MSKRYHYLYIAAFLLLLSGLGAMTMFGETKVFSENENRYLDNFSELSVESVLSGDYQEKFSSAVSDQFPVRDYFMMFSTKVKKLLGFSEISDVYVGKDNYYFEKKTADDINQIQFVKNLRYVEYIGQKHENKVNLLLVPSKATVLKEDLPKYAPYYDGASMFTTAENMLKYAKFIDPREKITEYSKQNQVYFKTDHHWTALGAYAAYSEFYNRNKMEKHTYGYFNVKKISEEFLGSIYSKALDMDAVYDNLYAPTNVPHGEVDCDGNKMQSVYDVEKLLKKDKYAYYFGGNYGEVNIKNPQGKHGKILIIKDSFANSFVPFMLEDYKDIQMIDLRYYNNSIKDIIEKNDYEKVLILYEISNFANDTKICKLVH